jgi:hypothetical protein
MKAVDIVFKTSRFNLSKVGEHFINPCCGEEAFHRERLRGVGKISAGDEMVRVIEEILGAEAGIREVRREE